MFVEVITNILLMSIGIFIGITISLDPSKPKDLSKFEREEEEDE
jgi:hypothetical protein